MSIKHISKPDKQVFMNETEIDEALCFMEEDNSLKTPPCYVQETISSTKLMSFREKHLAYLKSHPKINPENYLANLRTMIKIRS
jgi:hypothetical protein